jgi:hypothetical protein
MFYAMKYIEVRGKVYLAKTLHKEAYIQLFKTWHTWEQLVLSHGSESEQNEGR